MAVNTITIYEINIWEGGDCHRPSGLYFTNFNAAEHYTRNRDNMATITEKTFITLDNDDDLEAAKSEKKKQAVLAKLTKEERELLGF